jgi:hypothetical protein
MQSLYFTLVRRQVVACAGPEALAGKLGSPEWQVGLTSVGDWQVSTAFLGIDWNYGRGKPALFETVLYHGDVLHGLHARYATWERAEAGHLRAVARLRQRLGCPGDLPER